MQIIHSEETVGQPKVSSALKACRRYVFLTANDIRASWKACRLLCLNGAAVSRAERSEGLVSGFMIACEVPEVMVYSWGLPPWRGAREAAWRSHLESFTLVLPFPPGSTPRLQWRFTAMVSHQRMRCRLRTGAARCFAPCMHNLQFPKHCSTESI